MSERNNNKPRVKRAVLPSNITPPPPPCLPAPGKRVQSTAENDKLVARSREPAIITFATIVPEPLLRIRTAALPLGDTRVIAVTAVRGRGCPVSPTRAPIAPAAGTRPAAAATAVAARGVELLRVVLHRVGIQATRFRTRAARVRVRIRVARLPVPLVVLGLIEIVAVEHVVFMPIELLVHGRRVV